MLRLRERERGDIVNFIRLYIVASIFSLGVEAVAIFWTYFCIIHLLPFGRRSGLDGQNHHGRS